jgi:RNA polymerase sigma-70 factor (family 1)
LKLSDPNFKLKFELFYKQNYDGLLRFAKFYLKEEAGAHEVVQEVFINIWNTQPINEALLTNAYVYTSVKNRAFNYLRDKKLKYSFDDDAVEEISDSALNPLEILEFNNLKNSINEAILALPERCKLIFLLKRREQMSHKQIAALLEISEKTIENQITKALKLIRKKIEENKDDQ